ncbi:MAG: glycoside hydrolase family 127 protein [Armatimonadetes bacterium]|nr:glycoside hydrolase family 127 protein [Armatimonadota bacterium]
MTGLTLFLAAGVRAADEVRVVDQPPTGTPLYLGNRDPLVPSRLIKLPIGSITPRGWLRQQLELEAAGMTGHLEEISQWCRFDGNAWSHPAGQGHSGWEELPYWLKGFGDLGCVLRDQRITAEARRWIDAVIASQQPDGWFGPQGLKTSLDGKADFWPHMVMLNVLQSFQEATGDPRVVPLMTRYFRWQMDYPAQDFMAGFWPKMRAGDNLESVLWLYNRTGEAWLLDLARKIHEHAADWTAGIPTWHGVNLTQGFREPANAYAATGDRALLLAAERNYDTVVGLYGQVPGGMFGADENCRPGYTGARQAAETCSMVEFMHSFELLARLTANPLWADRCEEVAFNSLPAALTPDLKGLHYLTAPNQVRLDAGNKSPGVQNGGCMFAYSPDARYRCCQHNVSHGWPYYAEELWFATADRGLCAALYAASEVTARVGGGDTVTLSETTDYPFAETIDLRVTAERPVRFPLYLRVPRWCARPEVKLNGNATAVTARPLSYLVIDREWRGGDTVSLRLPMTLSVRTWAKAKNAVSVDYGPLTFSLKIGEEWRRSGGSDAWPDLELLPTSPWNYGLVLDSAELAKGLRVVRRDGPLPDQPFTPDAAPLSLAVQARKIPGWTEDPQGLVAELQPGPIRSDEALETVTLVPMGCARLRITAFPLIGGPEANEWAVAQVVPSASHCHSGDTVMALIDELEPANSNDHNLPRFTWWDHRGTAEWVQLDFAKPRKVSAVSVYWFDDTGVGACRVPKSWRLMYKAGDQWLPVAAEGDYGVTKDGYNKVTFAAVETSALRIEVQLQPEVSGGVLEWKIGP